MQNPGYSFQNRIFYRFFAGTIQKRIHVGKCFTDESGIKINTDHSIVFGNCFDLIIFYISEIQGKYSKQNYGKELRFASGGNGIIKCLFARMRKITMTPSSFIR